MLTYSKYLEGYPPYPGSNYWNTEAMLHYMSFEVLAGEIAYVRHTYKSKSGCTEGTSPLWTATTVPAEAGIRPPEAFKGKIKIPSAVAGEATGDYKIRIRTEDGSKWIMMYVALFANDTFITCSNSSYDHTGGSFNNSVYTGDVSSCTLEALVDGRVSCKVNTYGYYTSGCSQYSHLQYEYTTAGAVFLDSDTLVVELLILADEVRNYFPRFFGYSLTFTEELEYSWSNLLIQEYLGDLSALQDNNVPEGVLFFHLRDNGQEPKEWNIRLEEFFEWSSGASSVYWINTTRFFNPEENPWAVRLNFPIDLSQDWNIMVSGMQHMYVMFMNEDATKWIRFGLSLDSFVVIETSEQGEIFSSNPATYSSDYYGGYHKYFFEISEHSISFKYSDILAGYIEVETFLVDVLGLFIGDPVYFGFATDVEETGYLTDHISFVSSSLVHNVSFDQDPNTIFSGTFKRLAVSALEKTQAFTCYYRDFIKDSKDFSNPRSLYSMDPGSPSDSSEPLKDGDGCVVWDKFNRTYFYKARTGSQAHSLPDILRVSENLYWELIGVTEFLESSVEQYQIDGLVLGAPVLVTHSLHDQNSSIAPRIQLIHNNKIRTKGIVVSIVSSTQLRLRTLETEVLENLKINVYITNG